MPSPLQLALDSLMQRGAALPPGSAAAVRASLAKFSDRIAENTLAEVMDGMFGGLREILKPKDGTLAPGETGDTTASVRGRITQLLARLDDPQELAGALNWDFKLDVATRVASGAGRFLTDQTDVDEYPAGDRAREFERDVPRGFRVGAGGALVPVPNDDWPARFAAACEEAGDTEAARVLQETGRMIALKSSGVWAALGNGAGGYDDTLGNPFAPFAFNSGYRTAGVPRVECLELGLLGFDEKPQGSNYDFSQLIQLPEAA